MSKVDAQRAMREARYARTHASGPSRRAEAAAEGTTTPPATRTPRTTTTAGAAGAGPDVTPAESERCGHTSINGRACTRAAAHPEKSHRYG